MRSLLALTLCLSFTQSVLAARGGDFASDFAKKWLFQCTQEITTPEGELIFTPDQMNAFYRQEALAGVEKGLNDLKIINPPLYNKIVKRTRRKRIHWGCDFTSDLNGSASAYFRARRNILDTHEINITLDSLYTGVRQYLQTKSSMKLRSSLLHEFYHFAGVDNQIVDDHRLGEAPLRPGQFLDDVVFACVAQSYPMKLRYLELGPDAEKNTKAYVNTQNICNVCAKAVSTNRGRETVLPDDFNETLSPVCASVQNQKFHTGFLYRDANDERVFESLLQRRADEKYKAAVKRINEEHARSQERIRKMYEQSKTKPRK